MIVFNGVSIDSVAPVRIEDIRVSPISYNPLARPRPIRFGSEFVRMGGGERTVTLSFAMLEKNTINRHEALMALSKWARTDAEYRMELPIDPNKYLVCVCTSKPDPSTRSWWENKLKLVFTCYNNPYWTSKQEKSVACGTQFNVLGDAPPIMRIERTLDSSASSQSYSDGTRTMTFSTIPAGNMVIDLNDQTAAVGSTSIMQYYQPSGSFIIPKTGVQTITGTGTVKYRERFE
jgi:phage-related protein